MYLWNPIDVGYASGFTAGVLVNGEMEGKTGDTFEAGRLSEKEVVEDGNGTQVMLGEPFKFDKENIAEWKDVY